MRFFLLMIIFHIIITNPVFTQISSKEFHILCDKVEELERSRDSLYILNASFMENNERLDDKLREMYLCAFYDMELIIKEAFDKTDVISVSATYQEVIRSIINLHTEITRINNFTDAQKVFGINFIDQISHKAEETLFDAIIVNNHKLDEQMRKRKKDRFKATIAAILHNPVISGLMKSNPVSSVAHSIINQVLSSGASYLYPERVNTRNCTIPVDFKTFKNEYGAFKTGFDSLYIDMDNPLVFEQTNKAIASFTNAVSPYIELFDALSILNLKYASSLEVFMKASEQTTGRVIKVEKAFYAKLDAGDRSEAHKTINDFFNIGSEADLELLELKINDDRMNGVLSYADEVNEALLLLKNDFLKIISLEIELSGEYIHFFSSLLREDSNFPPLENSQNILLKIDQFKQLETSLVNQKERLESMK